MGIRRRHLTYMTYGLVVLWTATELLHEEPGLLATRIDNQPPAAATAPSTATGRSWLQAAKPYCNPVEVETHVRGNPPPATFDGRAHEAACLALAGKTDQARSIIRELDADRRWQAAGVVFEIGHPVADAGDDRAAGPIMELVVEFWPNHYMALYHAGAARFELGDAGEARRYLERFLEQYGQDDGWRRSAETMLGRI